MNALTNFLCEAKPRNNPKLLMDFPFNYLYKVNQMKHNLFPSQKKKIIIIIIIIIIIRMQSTKTAAQGKVPKCAEANVFQSQKITLND